MKIKTVNSSELDVKDLRATRYVPREQCKALISENKRCPNESTGLIWRKGETHDVCGSHANGARHGFVSGHLVDCCWEVETRLEEYLLSFRAQEHVRALLKVTLPAAFVTTSWMFRGGRFFRFFLSHLVATWRRLGRSGVLFIHSMG